MRSFGLAIFAVLFALSAPAQISVQVTQDQDQFLEGEAIPAAVRITNRSGQTLRLGAEDDWLTFTVEDREGSGIVVQKVTEIPVKGEFELESSKVATKRVDLEPYFTFTEPGLYSVIATLRLKQWGTEVNSPPRQFSIIRGTRIWEQSFGVPVGTNAVPEFRKYALQQANYLKGKIRLYLRLTDASGRVLRLLPVGYLVSFSRPEAQLDGESKLHLLYQYGPKGFSYTVFDTDAQLIKRQTYDYFGTRPRLKLNPGGQIAVVGGVRRVTSQDIPKPEEPKSEEPAAAAPETPEE